MLTREEQFGLVVRALLCPGGENGSALVPA